MTNAADNFWLGRDWDESDSSPIIFIETRLHDLSPFSAHEVELDGEVYKTAEHAYQALRVTPEARLAIMHTSSPMDAWRAAQECKERGEIIDHDKDELMEKIFRAKLAQHDDVRRVLLATKSRDLLKVFDQDYYWGTGADNSGQNKMGKLWVKLRTELQSS